VRRNPRDVSPARGRLGHPRLRRHQTNRRGEVVAQHGGYPGLGEDQLRRLEQLARTRVGKPLADCNTADLARLRAGAKPEEKPYLNWMLARRSEALRSQRKEFT
jgi:hypothetical protein